MNAIFYNYITNKCNLILYKWYYNKYVLSNYLLHLSSPHPTKIESFVTLYSGSLFNLIASIFKNTIVAFIYPLYKISDKPISAICEPDEDKNILVISHYIKKEQLTERVDFYFGDLLSEKNKKEYKILECLINHTNHKILLSPGLNEVSEQTVVLPKRVSFFKEYKIFGIQFINTVKWFFASLYEHKERKLFQTIATGFLAQESIKALRIADQIGILVKKYRFKKIVITWEGLAWERLVIQNVKMKFPEVEFIGFQHSVLLSSVNAMIIDIPNANPQKLITTNIYNKQFLEKNLKFNALIDIVGMPRINFFPNHDYRNKRSNHGNLRILVTPEGLKDECLKLFDFVFLLAKEYPQVHFVFRLHPIYPYSCFVKDAPVYRKLPLNCSISDNLHLDDDLLESDILFYRGSTTAISALMHDVLPVYIKMEETELSINPLSLYHGTYLEIANKDDLKREIIQNWASLSEKRFSEIDKDSKTYFSEKYNFMVFVK